VSIHKEKSQSNAVKNQFSHFYTKLTLQRIVYIVTGCLLYNISTVFIGKNEIGGACSTYGGRRGTYRALVGISEVKRSLERLRRRWEDNIKMDLQEVRYVGVWSGLIWHRIGKCGRLFYMR
jgi:hypothetical protein